MSGNSYEMAKLYLPDNSEVVIIPEGMEGWQPVRTIPKDRRIEVKAPPHTMKGEGVTVIWDENKPYAGVWRFDPPRGGLMIPISPVAWREVQD